MSWMQWNRTDDGLPIAKAKCVIAWCLGEEATDYGFAAIVDGEWYDFMIEQTLDEPPDFWTYIYQPCTGDTA